MNVQHKIKMQEAISDLHMQLTMNAMRARLSTLWLVVLLNVLFKDMHDFLRPGAIEFMMSGSVTDATLLVTGIALSGFVSMVALSRVLPYQFNRWINIIAALVFIISMLTIATPVDLDDTWYWVVELITLGIIIWSAWAWSNPPVSQFMVDA